MSLRDEIEAIRLGRLARIVDAGAEAMIEQMVSVGVLGKEETGRRGRPVSLTRSEPARGGLAFRWPSPYTGGVIRSSDPSRSGAGASNADTASSHRPDRRSC